MQDQIQYKHQIKRLWQGAVGLVVFTILFFIILSFQGLPDFKQLENPEFELATQVLDVNGREVGRYYTQNRLPVSYDSLNPYLVQALVATEDSRFFSHSGVDVKALGRVMWGMLTFNTSKGGGSTLTQQLAKLLFDRPDFSKMSKVRKAWTLGMTKFKEWITAVKLERQYTKEEILAMYLNKFNFIYGAYGISAASETYFGKTQEDLKIEEAATLIGMLKNPALFNPVRRPDTVEHRRMIVLNQMRKHKYISRSDYDSLRVLPLDISHFSASSHVAGPAPYFRMELANWLKDLFDSEDLRKPNGDKYNIYKDGLRVYTTIDLDMQYLAEAEMLINMKNVQDRYNRVWKNMDPWTYQADDNQKRIRQESLTSLIRRTNRYQSLHEEMISKEMMALSEKFDLALTDWDIDNLMEEDKKAGRVAKLVSSKTIPKSKGSKYKEILKSSEWDEFKKQWIDFQKEVDKVMKTQVDMMIFDYNEKGERQAKMSPLDSIKYHRKFMQTGSLGIDPKTGEIKFWVGGINNKYFQYDHIGSSRQVGSTFKPFIYATAITLQGISPCFPVLDVAYTIAPGDGSFGLIEPWTPRNADGKYTGRSYTLFEGLQDSRNTISVFLMTQLGNANVVRGLVHNMGIDSTTRRSDGEYRLPNKPSICLGAADLSVKEMTGAYCTFANNGVFVKPHFVTTIEDENGKVIYREVREEHEALPSKANAVMVKMLKYTAQIPGLKSEVGGKTGTTNDYVDGWFIGITPELVVGTWVGGEDPWIRFTSLADGQGSRMAKPFYREFMKKLEAGDYDYDPGAKFADPEGGLDIETDCAKYNALRKEAVVDPFSTEDEFNENE